MLGYGDVDPITSLGASDWVNYGVSVEAQVGLHLFVQSVVSIEYLAIIMLVPAIMAS